MLFAHPFDPHVFKSVLNFSLSPLCLVCRYESERWNCFDFIVVLFNTLAAHGKSTWTKEEIVVRYIERKLAKVMIVTKLMEMLRTAECLYHWYVCMDVCR